ncbi:MAG TPA: hypothetical protein VEJ63_07980 [Planctomycetota bacterium]|nr:hypothetical protein [Planctomycetota bacterium]
MMRMLQWTLAVVWPLFVFGAETPDGVPIETLKVADGREFKVPAVRTRYVDDEIRYVVQDKTYTEAQFRAKFPIVAEMLSADFSTILLHESSGMPLEYVYMDKKWTGAEFKKAFPHKFEAMRLIREKIIDGVAHLQSSVISREESRVRAAAAADEVGKETLSIETCGDQKTFKVSGKEVSKEEFAKRFPLIYTQWSKQKP